MYFKIETDVQIQKKKEKLKNLELTLDNHCKLIFMCTSNQLIDLYHHEYIKIDLEHDRVESIQII